MNERTFLQKFEQSKYRQDIEDEVYEMMVAFAIDEGIPVDEISNEELKELADGFTTRGMGVAKTPDTKFEKHNQGK